MVMAIGAAALRSKAGQRLKGKVQSKLEKEGTKLAERAGRAAVRKVRSKVGKRAGQRW